jgi:hypothetical protein
MLEDSFTKAALLNEKRERISDFAPIGGSLTAEREAHYLGYFDDSGTLNAWSEFPGPTRGIPGVLRPGEICNIPALVAELH